MTSIIMKKKKFVIFFFFKIVNMCLVIFMVVMDSCSSFRVCWELPRGGRRMEKRGDEMGKVTRI